MKHLHCNEVESYDAAALGLEGAEKTKIRILSDDTFQLELEAGGYTPDHIHDDKERLVIMAGKGTIKLKNEQLDVQSGDFIEIDNEQHQVRNTDSEPLVFVAFRNQC